MATNKSIQLDDSELATVLVALRMFQKHYDGASGKTIGDDWPDYFTAEEYPIPAPLGTADIDELCERINCSPNPRIVVTLEGGLVQNITSNLPAQVLVIDYDTEGAEEDRLINIPQRPGQEEEPAWCWYQDADIDAPRVDELFGVIQKQERAA